MDENNSYYIKAFPDDDREYVVVSYGPVQPNRSAYASNPLVYVTLKPLDTDSTVVNQPVVIKVAITDLIVIKIKSIWHRKKFTGRYDTHTGNGFRYIKNKFLNIDLQKNKPEALYLYIRNGKTVFNKKLSADGKFYTSVTQFSIPTKHKTVKVLIPSLELLVSTYVPHNHEILTRLLVLPGKEIVKTYVKKYSSCNKKCQYTIEPVKEFRDETLVFLAYLSCNNETQNNVAQIWNSLVSKHSLSGVNYDLSYIKVYPYHCSRIKLAVDGVYDKKEGILWVQRINAYSVPNECEIVPVFQTTETEAPNKGNSQQKDRNGIRINIAPIKESVPLQSEVDPGVHAGTKYIKSGVVILNEDKVVHRKTEQNKKIRKEEKNNVEKKTAESVSSGELSGQNASDTVGGVYVVPDEKEVKKDDKSCFEILIEIFASLKSYEIYYYNKTGQRIKGQLSFFMFKMRRDYLGKRTRWAIVDKRYRKLLVVEIVKKNGEHVFFLDIERKNNHESYSGITFRLGHALSARQLAKIRTVLARNKGRHKIAAKKDSTAAKKLLSFPIEDYQLFRHSHDKDIMRQRILKLLGDNSGTKGQ